MRNCRPFIRRVLAAALAMLAVAGPGLAQSPAAVEAVADAGALELLIRIPRDGTPRGMLTRICRPHLAGPTRLVVINHGSPPIAANRLQRAPPRCGEAARFFTSRGFTVAFPLRRGFGETGGAWAESYGKCNSPDFSRAGQATADDIEAALAHLRTLPFVSSAPAIVIGQSAGGWGTLALASRNPDGIATFVNFAGGRGAGQPQGDSAGNCSPDALVAAAGVLGQATRAETLWVYTRNDRLIAERLSRRMHEAYERAGGRARFELLADFETDGHNLFFGRAGSQIWGPIVDAWLVHTGVSEKAKGAGE
ncbi:MAG: alpha/beta hydrolase family protein [Hyphomicrobiaceae bacterium]